MVVDEGGLAGHHGGKELRSGSSRSTPYSAPYRSDGNSRDREQRVTNSKAKVSIASATPSATTNGRKAPSKVVIPPLPFTHLPAHLRVQSCIKEWSGLGDRHVEEVVKH